MCNGGGNPGNNQNRSWFGYFFGTPQRMMRSLVVIGLITAVVFPGLLYIAADRLLLALMPLLGPALTLLIVFAGIKMILGGGKKSK